MNKFFSILENIAASIKNIEHYQKEQIVISKAIMGQQGEEISDNLENNPITFVGPKDIIIGTSVEVPKKILTSLTYYNFLNQESNPVKDNCLKVKEVSLKEMIKNITKNEKMLYNTLNN